MVTRIRLPNSNVWNNSPPSLKLLVWDNLFFINLYDLKNKVRKTIYIYIYMYVYFNWISFNSKESKINFEKIVNNRN